MTSKHISLVDDQVYEDVQRPDQLQGSDNGWSSSEFESYDEQSDEETKPPARSKVWHYLFVIYFYTECRESILRLELGFSGQLRCRFVDYLGEKR